MNLETIYLYKVIETVSLLYRLSIHKQLRLLVSCMTVPLRQKLSALSLMILTIMCTDTGITLGATYVGVSPMFAARQRKWGRHIQLAVFRQASFSCVRGILTECSFSSLVSDRVLPTTLGLLYGYQIRHNLVSRFYSIH